MRDGMIVDECGTQRWYANGQLHRTDGPAVIYADGSQEWFLNGRWHRSDGPAVIWSDGSQQWRVNGQRHRVDGPAVIWPDGTQEWYVNDQLHRTDGPAFFNAADEEQGWWVNGNRISEEDVNQWMNKLDITYPFDEEYQALFLLTFGGK